MWSCCCVYPIPLTNRSPPVFIVNHTPISQRFRSASTRLLVTDTQTDGPVDGWTDGIGQTKGRAMHYSVSATKSVKMRFCSILKTYKKVL